MHGLDRMRAGKATIVEVAARAGVSTATASRVLGGYGYAGKSSRESVLAAASDLGYRPNKLARGLITGRTRTIGVIAGDISSPFYAAVLRGISDVAENRGLGMLITNSDETASKEVAAVGLLRENQVDGLIVSPCDVVKSPHLQEAVAAGMPLVLIDRKVKGLQVDSVAVENVQSSCDGVARLLAAGHRRIAFIAELGPAGGADLTGFITKHNSGRRRTLPELSTSWQRLGGYLAAHRAAGVEIDPALIVRVGKHSAQAARESAAALLGIGNPPSAFFCADGLMSAGTMAAIAASRLSFPDSLSLIGFDDLDWMGFVGPGIDAIAQPRRRIGRTAARLLLARIGKAKGKARDLLLSPRQVERGSVRSSF